MRVKSNFLKRMGTGTGSRSGVRRTGIMRTAGICGSGI